MRTQSWGRSRHIIRGTSRRFQVVPGFKFHRADYINIDIRTIQNLSEDQRQALLVAESLRNYIFNNWNSINSNVKEWEIYGYTACTCVIETARREGFPVDGLFSWESSKEGKKGYFHIRYTEGPGDRKWIDEQNKKYIRELIKRNMLEELEPDVALDDQQFRDVKDEMGWFAKRRQENNNPPPPALVVAKQAVVPPVQTKLTRLPQPLQKLEPQRITNSIRIPHTDLSLVKLLGSGEFGEVYEGKWINTDVAIKQLRKDVPVTDEMLEEFESEAERHASFRHPNIVTLFGVCLEQAHYGMVMELMVKGSLYDLLHNGQTLPWRVRLSIAQDVCNGILFLHKQQPPVVHRDLKSLNVLIDGSMRAKVSDFGLSKVKTSTLSMSNGPKGTFLWMAPELFDEEGKYTEHSDIYSLGVVLWEIASRELPHKTCQNQMQLYARVAVKGLRDDIPQDTPNPVSKLISRCWAQRREDRPDAGQVAKEIMSVKLI